MNIMKLMAVDEDALYRWIGDRLKKRRLELHLTQDDIASRVGVLRTSITNIEAGRQKTPLHVLYGLCEALDLDIALVVPPSSEVSRRIGPGATEVAEKFKHMGATKSAEFLEGVAGGKPPGRKGRNVG